MAKFDNIVIVSDMDGTFLGNDSRLVPENIEKIKYFNQNGGRFTIITGRNYTTAFQPYPQLAEILSAPVGLHNGACVYDAHSGKILYEKQIDTTTAMEIFTYLRALYPKISASLRCFDAFYFMPPDHASDWYKPFSDSTYDFYECEDMRSLSVHKINFRCEDKHYLATVRESVEKKFGQRIDCTTAEPEIVEIMSKGVSKGAVIPLMRKICSLENAKFFAIGDYENDLEMLKSADYAVCPQNALGVVKDICTIQVCHHDKGAIADLIQTIEEKYLG